MKSVEILDCTLRDGGYINEWRFGEANIRRICRKLSESNVDIIELGFLQDGCTDREASLFDTIEQTEGYAPTDCKPKLVTMISLGKFDINRLRPSDSVSGIRLIFRKNELDEAVKASKIIKSLGYDLYFQPVNTPKFTDYELLRFIEATNDISPCAFYIVDTFGAMYASDLTRIFSIVDHNLDSDIKVGYHAHNNLQLAFSNAISFLNTVTNRSIMLDSSVFGMGRGAGNLPTELITKYINDNIGSRYNTTPLFEIYDEILGNIYEEKAWGYNIPYALSAQFGCHPNYASALLEKQAVSVKQIGEILRQVDYSKTTTYDKKYIEQLYINCKKNQIDDSDAINKLRKICEGREVLLLAPGGSLKSDEQIIADYSAKNDCLTISVNFVPESIRVDAMFISNAKRFENFENMKNVPNCPQTIICTSNLEARDEMLAVNYADYLNEDYAVADNAGLMCINLLIRVGCSRITLAGFDGFCIDKTSSYYSPGMRINIDSGHAAAMNRAITEQLKSFGNVIPLKFLTKSMYEKE